MTLRSLALLGLAGLLGAATGQAQGPAQPKLAVGQLAPDFTLRGSDGKTYRLSDYRGKSAVVLAWFPKAFTAG